MRMNPRILGAQLSETQEVFSTSSSPKLENHVIVMGYGLLGVYVVDKLKQMGLSCVVVIRDDSQLADLQKSHVTALASPMAKSFQTLETAGASKASAIIATFDDDGDNLLSILNAEKINPNLRAITVINDRDMVEAASASGADVVLTPYELTGQLLALSTVSKRTSALFVKGSFKEKHISEFVIDGDGKATYHDLNKIAPILMVSRKGATTVNPKEEFGLKRGDIIYTMTDTSSLIVLEDELIRRRMISSSHDKSASGDRQLARSGGSEDLSSRINDFVNVILYGPLSIIRQVWIQIFLLAFMLGFGTAIFSYYQQLPLLTAFVGAVSTITTIGIYAPNIVGMSDSELVLLAITFIVSVGLAASIVQGILTSVISRDALRVGGSRERSSTCETT